MFQSKAKLFRSLMLSLTLSLLPCAQAMATDLADNPLSSATTADVKPNILFTLDNSGSMNWKFMPDALTIREHTVGFRNGQCNLVYYNPNSRYVTPKTSTGGDVNAGSPTKFTAAYDDGYGAYLGYETRTSADSGATWSAWTSAANCTEVTTGAARRQCRVGLLASAGTTTDLSAGFRAFVDSTIDANASTSKIDTAQPAYYWKYAGSTTLVPATGDCEKPISPNYTVNNASYAAGVTTYTTSAAHNFLVGHSVNIINIQPAGYRGSFVVATVPSATTFTVAMAGNPGAYTNSGTAWNATYYATIKEICTDNTATTSTCAALGKTALWQKVVVSATSGPATVDVNNDGAVNSSDQDERQNFANWYSYYSKRIQMMKSASGRAFLGMNDSKRIGLITINSGNPVSRDKFRTIADFDVANKEDWFNTLYSQSTGSSTPLREALSRAGRYFAGKTDGINSGMNGDPVQYSCQQNFTILTTDGYWNGNGGLKLDGATAMDNQDGIISELDAYRSAGSKYAMAPRPIFDGASTTYTWNTATRKFQNVACLRQEMKTAQLQKRTGQWQQQTSQLQKKAGQLQFQSTIEANTTGQLQWRTSIQRKTGQLQFRSTIQRKSGQLQFSTNLQKKTGQLQYQSKIQSKTGQLQARTSINSGLSWSGWANAATCVEVSSGVFRTQCQVGTGSFVQAQTCAQTRTGSAGSYSWFGGASAVDCQVVASYGAFTNATTCTEIPNQVNCQVTNSFAYVTPAAPTCTPNRTGVAGSYVWTGAGTNGNATVDCRTTSFSAAASTGLTCTANANTVCTITGSFLPAQSCVSNVSGSTYTPAGTSGNATVDCLTGQPVSSWVNVTSGTCTANANVGCQITGSFAHVATYPPSCTSNVSGSVYTAAGANGSATVECQNIANNWGSYTTVAASAQCQDSADVQCALIGGSWAAAPSCTPNHNRAASRLWTARSGTNTETDCRTAGAMSSWLSTSNCTQGAQPEGTVDCRINASAVGVPAAQCASPTRSGVPGAYTYGGGASAYECDTVVTAPYADVAYACTPAPTPDASGYTTQCQLASPSAWADAVTCVVDATTECQTIDLTGWVAADTCLPVVTPDGAGQTTQCRNTATGGSKLQSYATTTATTYSGPGQSGTVLGVPSVVDGALSDVVPGACYASAPVVPPNAEVTGSGPPTPPDNCTSGTQAWPCETYSAGLGGVSANIASASWTPPGADPTIDPAFAVFITSAAHPFLVGHSVTIAGTTNAVYRGNFQVIEVANPTSFKVLLPDNPLGSSTGGTATLYAGSSNSLADVAQYYYKTDLRNTALGNCTGALGGDVCENNVPSTGSGIEDDRANWQHMTTFTMGLGLTGTVAYSPTYRTDQCVTRSISGATWAANVVTVTTGEPHGFFVNQAVTISGGSTGAGFVPGPFRGQYRVATIPSSTTFTYSMSPNPGGAFGTGTAAGCPDFNRLRTGTINWPIPVADSPTALDDLWHAAVNGRGQYFSAGNPDTVVTSLSAALAGINARVAAAAAAATSNLEPVAGDNFAYTAKYKTQAWTGDLEAREINLATGAVGGTVIWSAQAKLDAATKLACDNRTIKLFRAGATNNLVDFKWNTYGCDGGGSPTGAPVTTLNATEQASFDATKVALLSHYPNLGDGTGGTANQRAAAVGANLVNYLRGQRGKEGFSSGPPASNTDLNKLYRTREHVLGDIVNAQPVFVKAPFAEYDDVGYVGFKLAQAARTPIVYSAANDGMLHAVYAGTSIIDPNGGNESWAFIPTIVLPNLYKPASENYATEHGYTVDGTPSVGDVYDPNPIDPVTLLPTTPTWKTILVSGLNKGGRGYYALDVTDPATPTALWEFKHDPANCVTVDATSREPATAQYADCHLGYSFNNPIISKLKDGRWVVFVTSGYNNVNSPSAPGDGIGYLYVLEAMTGKILYKIGTGVGSSVDPSGLNHISGWVESSLRNNTTERVYGVDLKGNIWRFDVNDILNAAGREATRLATMVDGSGVGQPITTRPELALVQNEAFVYVGTGRYLGVTDLSDTQQQTVWAVRDTLSATPLSNLRNSLRKMTITNHGSGTDAFRTNGCTAQCGSADGWYSDLPDSGERVNIDMKLQLGTLVVASNVPETNACNIGGYAWLNYFNSATGAAVNNSADSAVGRRLVGTGGQESLAVGLNIVRLPSGKIVVIATTSAAQQLTVEAPFDVAPPTGKRVSWRELVQ